jgi:hypothetical protein
MVFYRTIYDILTDFNASAAGFIFESFLSVLLDAERGHQIPASGAKTIADFVVYPNNQRLPISLKLYAADTLKVGGSYIQLIEDLTGELGMMQYIVITKLTGDNKEIQELRFYGFNFTLNNVSQILTLTGEAGLRQMCLPISVVNAYGAGGVQAVKELLSKTKPGKIAGALFVRTRAGGGASELDPTGQYQIAGRYRYDINLDIPAASKISIKPAIEAIETSLENKDSSPMSIFLAKIKSNDNESATKVKNAFMGALDEDFKVLGDNIDELEIGQSRTDEKIYAYTSSGKVVNIKTPTRKKIYNAIYTLLDDRQKASLKDSYTNAPSERNPDPYALRDMIKHVIENGKAAQEDVPKPEAGQDPRSQRIQAIYGDFSNEQRTTSVEILNIFKGVEKKKLLKLTAGYQGVGGDSQFEITSKEAFKKLYTPEYAGNLPYAPLDDPEGGNDGAFAVLQLTEQKVLEVQNYVLDSFNENMANALNAMQKLVDDMNTYVVGGLTDSRKAEDASEEAGKVKTSMEEEAGK